MIKCSQCQQRPAAGGAYADRCKSCCRKGSTVVKTDPLRRNAKCPCGSGKKYKHCHMRRVDANVKAYHKQVAADMDKMFGDFQRATQGTKAEVQAQAAGPTH